MKSSLLLAITFFATRAWGKISFDEAAERIPVVCGRGATEQEALREMLFHIYKDYKIVGRVSPDRMNETSILLPISDGTEESLWVNVTESTAPESNVKIYSACVLL